MKIYENKVNTYRELQKVPLNKSIHMKMGEFVLHRFKC